MSYFSDISDGLKTTLKGMKLSISYFFQARKKRQQVSVFEESYYEKSEGIFTVQYPKESIPIPDNGRYQLHNEIDDCIVCDKCAKICPVDCIDIEPVRATEAYGQTSDGTSLRIYPAKFDIDMAKCCFCGLCTVVCPTECLTMTKEYDFSTSNILDHNFSFSKMSEKEIQEKKKELEEFQSQKAQAKTGLPEIKKSAKEAPSIQEKPVFKPRIPGAKPVIKPRVAPKDSATEKPKMPVIKPKINPENPSSDLPKRPSIKPVIKPVKKDESAAPLKNSGRPIIKPKIPKKK